MKSLLRNLAIALLILTITVLAWLTDPAQEKPCSSINDDVAGVLLSEPESADGMETRALGATAQCDTENKETPSEPK
jgi:hypothetical protein